jgi:hypothetical protein
MARIRTIKPEFPQSESMGKVSRDARLCFVQMWTIADDSGRLRGNSRMLASLLFPYDDDAPGLIDCWLLELEQSACIVRYVAEGSTYIQIANWLSHQKIDKPSPSKIPPPEEGSRILANPLERSSLDQGSRTKDQGEDQGGEVDQPAPKREEPQAPASLNVRDLEALGVDKQHAQDWLKVRKAKRAPLTLTAWEELETEARKAGISAAQAVAVCARKSWQGFNASWKWRDALAGPSSADRDAEAIRLLGFEAEEVFDA